MQQCTALSFSLFNPPKSVNESRRSGLRGSRALVVLLPLLFLSFIPRGRCLVLRLLKLRFGFLI